MTTNKVKVNIELTEAHELILSALFFHRPESFDELVVAVRLLDATHSRYLELLKITVRGAIDKDSLFCLLKPTHPGTLSRWEIEKDFKFLQQLGLVSKEAASSPAKGLTPKLTDEGERVAGLVSEGRKALLRAPGKERTTVFVASHISCEEVDGLFQQEIEPLCSDLGYAPLRVDRTEPDQQSITAAILEGIREAACVIADLTYARPSVYFEVGLAHGLGVPFILTCRQDHHDGTESMRKVHFDLEQYKISYWSLEEGGKYQWKHTHPRKRLQDVLGARGRT